jgi:subtilisin family serine protease
MIDPKRIDLIRAHVRKIRRVSRYFNAVSAEVEIGEIPALGSLPCVMSLDVVRQVSRRPFPEEGGKTGGAQQAPYRDDPVTGKYGPSMRQLDIMQTIELLELGYNGSGEMGGVDPVLVCVMDTGFDRNHEALASVKVVAEWDFIQNDSITWNEEGDADGQDRHGTVVLGAIAGYHEGDLIGPAWGAEFLLAKTEIDSIEIRAEEDNWIAGIEWADSIGADIVSSSLGYLDWYGLDDLDGQTALCTRAANIAASRGIVVVNSAGNFGWWGPGWLVAPADADSVIAVGAVDRYGEISSMSSRGPTADGRIKPDVCAMGVGVHTVMHRTTDQYNDLSGTSFSAPLVAGLCALLLEIHPEWDPARVKQVLLETATMSGSPGNDYGYGIVQGLDASGLDAPDIPESVIFSRGYPNPFRDTITFDLFLPRTETVSAWIFDCRGKLVRTLVENEPMRWSWNFNWDGTNNGGQQVSSGVYFLLFESQTNRSTFKVVRLQ